MASDQSFFQVWSPRLLSVLRIVTALLFMMHGTAKLFQMPHQAMFDNLQLMSLMGLQGVLEAGGGLLAEELAADPQRRRPCGAVLLCIPLPVGCGFRSLEHRCATS